MNQNKNLLMSSYVLYRSTFLGLWVCFDSTTILNTCHEKRFCQNTKLESSEVRGVICCSSGPVDQFLINNSFPNIVQINKLPGFESRIAPFVIRCFIHLELTFTIHRSTGMCSY